MANGNRNIFYDICFEGSTLVFPVKVQKSRFSSKNGTKTDKQRFFSIKCCDWSSPGQTIPLYSANKHKIQSHITSKQKMKLRQIKEGQANILSARGKIFGSAAKNRKIPLP